MERPNLTSHYYMNAFFKNESIKGKLVVFVIFCYHCYDCLIISRLQLSTYDNNIHLKHYSHLPYRSFYHPFRLILHRSFLLYFVSRWTSVHQNVHRLSALCISASLRQPFDCLMAYQRRTRLHSPPTPPLTHTTIIIITTTIIVAVVSLSRSIIVLSSFLYRVCLCIYPWLLAFLILITCVAPYHWLWQVCSS